MEIIRAEHSGFCFGVKRAIDMAFKEAENQSAGGSLFSCGDLIHNKDVVNKLHEKGVRIITSIEDANYGDVVIVRSHGEPKEFYEIAKKNNIKLIDTTCIFVEKIHKLVNKAHENGKKIVIVGSKDHQEVKATNGWCDYTAEIIENLEVCEKFINKLKEDSINDNLFIVAQTTIKRDTLKSILNMFDDNGILYEYENTICDATFNRQKSCKELAKKVDAMIVIGDEHSSNSRKLYDIAKKHCKNSYFIQHFDNFLLREVRNYNKIGLIAGASTPEWTTKEVIERMSGKDFEKNPMMDFMEDIEKSLRLPRPGDIVDGKVDQVMDDAVIVNLGCKKDGILKYDETVLEEGQSLSDVFKPGDEVRAKVIKSDDGEGGIMLSNKMLVAVENFIELEQAMENNEIISVTVTKLVNGGVIASYKEITGFIPMSQLSDTYVENAEEFLNETFDVKIMRVDTRRNRAVFSRKAVISEEKRKVAADIWANLNVGDTVEGKVMRFTDYGAFVDIGGVDGLLHISEISWGKLKHPQEVLNIGDIINVRILSLNEETGKISLGLKQTKPEPWSLVGDKYQIGDVFDGKIVQVKEYGAFVELESGLDGLVHISEIGYKHVDNVFDELKVGDKVQVKIMEIDPDKKRISLSIKATMPEPEKPEEPEEKSDNEESVVESIPEKENVEETENKLEEIDEKVEEETEEIEEKSDDE